MKADIHKIETLIHFIRGHRVMLDSDLAMLYQVETSQLKRAVRRNKKRFPGDFMFQLSMDEYHSLRCQIGTLERGAHSKYLPFVYTEQGVAMLSGVLHSARAIEMNISIMRAFVRMRQYLSDTRELAGKLRELERKVEAHDVDITAIFDAIRQLMAPQPASKNQIGFQHIGK